MIELLPAFFAVAFVGLSIAGAALAAVFKTVILRWAMSGGCRPRLRRVAAVAVWETLTMSLTMFVAFSRLDTAAVRMTDQKVIFIAAALALATVLQVFLALFPNHWLMQSGDRGVPVGNNSLQGIGMAVFLSLVAPVVTSVIVLGVLQSLSC